LVLAISQDSHTPEIIMKTLHLDLVKSQLFQLATCSNFESILTTAFGTQIEPHKVRQLRKQWLMGNFSVIPPIEVLAEGELGIASGGYAASEDKIFVSADFLAQQQGNPQAITGLLLEEIGHKLDLVFNGHVDSPGDEGEIFSRLVSGQNLSAATLARLKAEDDRAVITIGGKAVSIEQQIIVGTAMNDNLFGTLDSDDISGRAGNDTLYGGTGNDTLSGGDDNDILDGGTGNDTLRGGSGRDALYGEADNDSLYGESGNDTLRGGYGDDNLYGESDNDSLYGESGNDLLRGGDGDDTVYGGEGNDRLSGVDGNDLLYGEADNDTLYGGFGNDTLYGGFGNDYFSGEDGNDYLSGEDGNDTIFGGVGNDALYGGSGDDTLAGGEGNDTLQGEKGNDNLVGGNGNDNLVGGSSNDTLFGQDGNDFLSGGSGRDRFYFTTAVSTGRDTITDFFSGIDFFAEEVDRIVLRQSVFANVTSANGTLTNFSTVANDAAALAGTSSAAILYSTSTGNLFYNQNGTLAGLGISGGNFAQLANLPNLTASDFLIE
jgi:Ca2+-binding RTX toxin-like protein